MNKDFLLEILVCPKCHGSLAFICQNEKSGFVCETCSLFYPVKDDIPIMLIDEGLPWPLPEK